MILKKVLVINVVALVLVLIAYMYVISAERPSFYCTFDDHPCIAEAILYKLDCIPAVITLEMGNETGMVTLLVDIDRTWPWGHCILREEILNQTGRPVREHDITGYGTECVTDAGGKVLTCNGSFHEYLISTLPAEALNTIQSIVGSESASGDGAVVTGPPTVEILYCPLEDDTCKEEAGDYINWCTPAVMQVTDLTMGADPANLSYWVKRFEVSRSGSSCKLEVEIVSAFNLPPYIPLDIVGMEMACTYSLSDLPKESIDKVECTGELVDYFWKF